MNKAFRTFTFQGVPQGRGLEEEHKEELCLSRGNRSLAEIVLRLTPYYPASQDPGKLKVNPIFFFLNC